ncbi:hypothetical protein BBJ28_00025152, partial [Nothophytophthora sp. Chile5]
MAPSTPATDSPTKMTHRFLGNSGLLVSKFALGSWMWSDDKYTVDAWYELMLTAFKGGVNFFDTAENYGETLAERNMGGAIQKGLEAGVWNREDLVVTIKLFAGTIAWDKSSPNAQGLCRKHIIEGTQASLRRMQLNYADVIFCHRPDACTPIEETVRAMNYVIEKGWAFYWGTSEWLASDIAEACEIADRLGLIRPIVEQPQYNILERNKVEFEFLDLYKKYKLGLTVWSPLSSGMLTGKYSAEMPEGARYSATTLKAGPPIHNDHFAEQVEMTDKLKPIAKELGCSLAQLALAWCVSNENVSTVLLGASRPAQLEENLKALDFVSKITPEVKAKIDAVVNFVPRVPTMDHLANLHLAFRDEPKEKKDSALTLWKALKLGAVTRCVSALEILGLTRELSGEKTMEKVELWCGVYGEGSLFSVEIERNAKVSALQKAIVNEKKDVNDRFKVDPATLTLYLARKGDGGWLKDDESLDALLLGRIDKQYKEVRPMWKLMKPELLGPAFQPGEREIHVLVELPPSTGVAPRQQSGLWR